MSDIKQTISLVLFGGAIAFAAVACGPPEDPSNNNDANNNTANNTTANNTTANNTSANNTSANNTSTNNTNTNNTTANNTTANNTNTNNTNTNNTTANNTSNDDCAFVAMFKGQVESDKGGGGGVFAAGTSSYEMNSGLEQVYSRLETAIANDEGEVDMETDSRSLTLADAEKIQITGAVVTSTSFEKKDDQGNYIGATRLTFQDQQVGVLAFLDLEAIQTDVDNNPVVLRVGSKVDFTITSLLAFGGTVPQISGIEGLKVTGEGVDVGVIELSDGGALTMADHYMKMVRIHGVVKTENGGCGGSSICYEFEYGPEGSKQTTTLRTSSEFVEVGDCGTYVGPVGSFPGFFDEGASPQLDSVSFSWYAAPFKN